MTALRTASNAAIRGALLGTVVMATSTCAPIEDTASLSQASVCAAGATVEGIDVSIYEGAAIDWNAIHASGREFAITRINDGYGSVDTTFAPDWSGIHAAGMVRGAYQFYQPMDDPMTQANTVCSTLGTLGAGDLPAILDLEVTGGQTAATIISGITTWLTRVEACTGKVPIIYTGAPFWNASVGSTAFSRYPLWIPAYGPTCPNLPMGWSNWLMFQYSDGTTPAGEPIVPSIGQACDRSKYNGSLADLQTFAGTPGTSTPVYGAAFVAQSFPYSSVGPLQVHQGETIASYIEMRNSGTAPWNSSTRLATTVPRDRASLFVASDWVSSSRLAAVTGTVAPGANFRFMFGIYAPPTLAPGMYDEHFGIVQEGTAWFSDPGQLGPPDSQLEGIIQVLPAVDGGVVPTDAGVATPDAGTVTDAAISPDAGPHDASTRDAGHDGGVGHDGGGSGASNGSCACAVPGGGTSTRVPGGSALLAAVALAVSRRRRPVRCV